EVTPLHITQPEGVGFALDGHLLSWQNWQLRLGFNHREGLVLNQVAVRDGQRWRSVAYRLSFAEMVVPYRDASPDHYRRTAFDIGEWGLGFMTTSLSLGCDCLGDITYLDAVVHDSRGEPRTIPNAICVHEEDSGVGWKHVDERAGVEVRRARRLVISFHVTVANYEYLVYWRFYQDGNIECEVRATGILVTSHTGAPGSRPDHGTLVDHGIYAPFHQHFIVARLDPASPAYQRAEVIGHTLWVTPYREDERWPCGDFPVQSEHDSGLAAWTRADRSIEDTDVVLWYVFGIHHITRPEDWPVMPSDIVSFWLKPFGFFDRNPALDVPPTAPDCHTQEGK